VFKVLVLQTLLHIVDRDGGFGEWSLFSNCTETCGEEGVQTRSRTCDSPSPEGKGAECQDEDTESQPCNRILVNPHFSVNTVIIFFRF